MATRRTILLVGDLSAAGQVPVSGLTAINPTYNATQDNFLIWETQGQTWERLTPGVNSNPTFSGTNFWGIESRLRSALSTQFPSGNLYCIKHTPDADATSWEGSTYTDLIAEVTSAAAAANASGDDLSIDGIIVSIMVDDFKLGTWRSYKAKVRQLINNLRTDLASVAHCAVGTVRDDGGLTPAVVLEPHYRFTGLSAPQAGQLVYCRMQIQSLQNEDERISVQRSHSYLAHTDNETFSASSMVQQAEDVAKRFWPLTYDDEGNTEARVVGIFGDSSAEGWLTSNGSLPAHQQAALTGANIWSPTAGQFATLQAGVNNQISVPSVLGHGYEISLADSFRDSANVWIVKGSQINSFVSDHRGLLGVATPPHQQRDLVSWSPGREQLLELHVRGSLVSAIESLRVQNRKPVMSLVVLSMGINDTLIAAADARQVVLGVLSLMRTIKKICDDLSVDRTGLKFVVMVPPDYAKNGADPFDTVNAADLSFVREGLLELPVTEEDVYAVDLSNHEASSDGYHLSTSGVRTAAEAAYAAWKQVSPSNVEPLFSPDMAYLRSALRLSKLDPENDAVDMIDAAVLSARGHLFRSLGEARITALQQIAFTRNPLTADEYLRVTASDTEIKMVRAQLIRVMPLMFMDGAAPTQTWQEEAAFRDGSYLQTRDEIRRLEAEIRANLEVLAAADLSKYSNLNVATLGPDSNSSPGASVFGVF